MANNKTTKLVAPFEPTTQQTEDYNSDDGVISDIDEMLDSSSLISDTSSSNLSSIDGDISGSDKGSTTSLMDIEGEDKYMVSRDGRKWKGTGGFLVPSISIDYIPTPSEKVIKGSSILELFKLFFTEELSTFIMNMTNKKLLQYLEAFPDKNIGNKHLATFSLNELYGLFGLLILNGVFRANKEPLNEIYSEDPNKSRPIFKASMPRERLKYLLRFLRFDDFSTRIERIKIDKLAPIRYVFEKIRCSLFDAYDPGKYLTLDEHLCRYRGRCPFRQYIPSKPDKYGIKIWIIADARTYYPVELEIYLGKQQLSNKTEDLVCRLALKLRPGHILIGDNYFTSINMIERLRREKKVSYFGTLRRTRKEIPKKLLDIKRLPEYSSKFIFDEMNTMISYVRKKNKSVLLLSNVHHSVDVSNTVKQKPQVILDYNQNKCGVDKLDQLLKEFRPYRTTRRWPCVIFFDLLAFASHASWVLYCLQNPDSNLTKHKNRKEFLYKLGHQLVLPLIKLRKESPEYRYLHRDVKLSMDFMINYAEKSISQSKYVVSCPNPTSSQLDDTIITVQTTIPEVVALEPESIVGQLEMPEASLVQAKNLPRGRCFLCKRSKDKKVKTTCLSCKTLVCSTHSKHLTICIQCEGNFSF